MNCAQLSKDLESLKASRDAMQKCFDSAEETHRGGVALKEVVNNYGTLSDDILSEYLDDFEKQYPDKWIRGFREIEEVDEEMGRWVKKHIIDKEEVQVPGFFWEKANGIQDEAIIKQAMNSPHSDKAHHIYVDTETDDSDYQNDYHIYDLGDGRIIAIVRTFYDRDDYHESAIKYFKKYDDGDLVYDRDISADFYMLNGNPNSLLQLDSQTIAIGCENGEINLMVQKEDGSWSWVDRAKWEEGSYPKMALWRDNKIALCDNSWDSSSMGRCALLNTANDPWVLKECLHKFTRKEDE